MKFQKLFLSAATGCLLVGASGAAMAVDCASGTITNTTVPEIIIENQPCHISDVIVEGEVDIQNSTSLTMIRTSVGGSATINAVDFVSFSDNTIVNDLSVGGSDVAAILGNQVDGNMLVSETVVASVQRNRASSLLCFGVLELFAILNVAQFERCFQEPEIEPQPQL